MDTSKTDLAAFFRTFGTALGEGVPLADALRREGSEVAEGLALAVERGSSFSEALLGFPDAFPSVVVGAVRAGEQAGTLDRECLRIAAAAAAGDLAALAGGPSVTGAEDAEAREAVDSLLEATAAGRASDLHIDPMENGAGHVRLRIDGVLQDSEGVPADMLERVLARMKIMAGLDVAEKRRPQSGRILARIAERDLDLRVTTAPTVHGERVVLRVLDPEQVRLTIDDVILEGEDRERIRSLATLPHGLVIVNGPTGSGKTTTLYAMLREATRPGVSVVSLEDPVEYILPGVVQMQVAPQFDFTFAAAHRAALRQDPDVMMIGEIRDLEQIVLAARTAMTGHMVFTALHAQTSPEAVARLLNLGVQPYLLNASLTAVISQRLVRKLCPDCKKPVEPDSALLPEEALPTVEGIEDPQFCAPVGCEKCRRTGHRGRAAIHEILVMDEDVRSAVAAGPDPAAIRAAARRAGMKTFLECGLEYAARGITTIAEVVRVLPT